MPSIDDLKQNADSVNIDMVSNNTASPNQKVVNLSSVKTNNVGNKTIITAKGSNTSSSSLNRVEFDISSAPKDTSIDENVHESLAKDILEGDDSVFSNYLKDKKEEMDNWVEEKEEERELNETEEDISETNDVLNSISAESNSSTSMHENYAIMEDEIFDDNIEDKSEDEESNSEADSLDNIKKESENKEVTSIKSNMELEESGSTTTDIVILDEEDETETETENDQDEVIKHLQELATERLKPVSQKLDISSFTILKKPTINTKFLQQQQVNVAKWVLPGQESIVQMKEYLGSELEQLREYSEDSTSITSLTRKFRSIYDHIVSPKPSTYEAWLKSTPYTDIDHYFFAIYVACFKGANYIPVDCPNKQCNETFLSEDLPIMDMVKFESDETKEKFQRIYQNETTFANTKGLYTTEVVPMSNAIAVSFKEPSIYSLMEIASLDERFREKYESILDYIPYIDSLYIIDIQNQSLEPIGFKGYADNASKTIKSKIQKYDSVLKSLSIDEFGPIKAYIRAIRDRKSDFSYIFPAITCPKCGTSTKETEITAEEMVFTRYQLGNLVTTSLK